MIHDKKVLGCCGGETELSSPDTQKPLLIANQVIQDHSDHRVDTLHMENLLHLGKGRYLTTLLMKHFPLSKMQFNRDACAFTVALDNWKVLHSQHRRCINSTVHILGGLVLLEQLCGFCCFSRDICIPACETVIFARRKANFLM
jgi:chitin synthase